MYFPFDKPQKVLVHCKILSLKALRFLSFNVTLILFLVFDGCQRSDKVNLEEIKKEIFETEIAFSKMSVDSGVMRAFLQYSAPNAVLNRGGKIIAGKTGIRQYFESQTLNQVKLDWRPEYVDVSQLGDMGYTYGPYRFSAVDSTGKDIRSNGIFHTVWKKQSDGSWKFVYD